MYQVDAQTAWPSRPGSRQAFKGRAMLGLLVGRSTHEPCMIRIEWTDFRVGMRNIQTVFCGTGHIWGWYHRIKTTLDPKRNLDVP